MLDNVGRDREGRNSFVVYLMKRGRKERGVSFPGNWVFQCRQTFIKRCRNANVGEMTCDWVPDAT